MAKASQVERQARALCVELARVTGGRPVQWRLTNSIGKALGLDQGASDAAIAYAIGKDWLLGGR